MTGPAPALVEGSLRPARGLTSLEAAARRAASGPNIVTERKDAPLWMELLKSVAEPLQLLLLAVGVLYAFLGEIRDGAVIFGVIVAVASLETWTERRAGRATAALAKLSAPRALVWRDDSLIELWPEDLVVNDVILLSAGCRARRMPGWWRPERSWSTNR